MATVAVTAWLAYISIVLSGAVALFVLLKVWPVARDAYSLLREMSKQRHPSGGGRKFRPCDRCQAPIFFDSPQGFRDAVLLHDWFECSGQGAWQ